MAPSSLTVPLARGALTRTLSGRGGGEDGEAEVGKRVKGRWKRVKGRWRG